MSKFRIKTLVAGLIAAAVMVVLPASAVLAGYAPANRPTFQCVTPTNCPGADYVTFNSFTNAPNYGDERAFLDAKSSTITGPGGYQDSLNVQDGQKYVVRAYIHNNANRAKIGDAASTAKNVKLQVLLPTSKKTSHMIGANISASNSNPGNVSDTVSFSGQKPFTIEFDKSAPVQVTYRPNGQGEYVTRTLPGAAFANDQTLNAALGDVKGCFEYASLVTMTVVVKMDKTPPTPPEKPKTPETPTTPEQPQAPGKLPVTGPAGVAAVVTAVTGMSSAAYYFVVRRRSEV